MEEISLKNKRKMRKTLFIAFFVLLALIIRIAFLQFFEGKRLQTLAYEQQAKQRTVTAKRGTIFDSTGKNILAISSTVFSITVNPTNISAENKEKTSHC